MRPARHVAAWVTATAPFTVATTPPDTTSNAAAVEPHTAHLDAQDAPRPTTAASAMSVPASLTDASRPVVSLRAHRRSALVEDRRRLQRASLARQHAGRLEARDERRRGAPRPPPRQGRWQRPRRRRARRARLPCASRDTTRPSPTASRRPPLPGRAVTMSGASRRQRCPRPGPRRGARAETPRGGSCKTRAQRRGAAAAREARRIAPRVRGGGQCGLRFTPRAAAAECGRSAPSVSVLKTGGSSGETHWPPSARSVADACDAWPTRATRATRATGRRREARYETPAAAR